MKYVKITIGLIVLLTVGCKADITVDEDIYGNEIVLPQDTYKVYDINDKISIIYGQTGSIYIKDNGEHNKVQECLGSYPELSPNKSSIAFVTGETDAPGELYLYKFKDNKKIKLLDNNDGNDTPKAVKWLDNKKLIVITGYGHGTVKMGGKVQICNIDNKKITPILIPNDMSEYRKITKNGDSYEFELITWKDDSYNEYDTEIKIYTVREINQLIN
ncbi:MAG: DUF4652 domain-containing protein [Vallitalea sp.]|jgi:hypothetical protein|nr:DUF4652 domain-containing protein [Vallitalea sp.]